LIVKFTIGVVLACRDYATTLIQRTTPNHDAVARGKKADSERNSPLWPSSTLHTLDTAGLLEAQLSAVRWLLCDV